MTIPASRPGNYALRFTTGWYPTDPRTSKARPVLRVTIVVAQP